VLKWYGIVLSALILMASPVSAAVCDYPEQLLIDALATEPTRLVVKLEGKSMESFLGKMEAAGYLSGSLPNIVSIYIIKGKLLPGHTEPIDILFFIDNQGCIAGKVYGTASIVEAML
jgi:hypothetical protein